MIKTNYLKDSLSLSNLSFSSSFFQNIKNDQNYSTQYKKFTKNIKLKSNNESEFQKLRIISINKVNRNTIATNTYRLRKSSRSPNKFLKEHPNAYKIKTFSGIDNSDWAIKALNVNKRKFSFIHSKL